MMTIKATLESVEDHGYHTCGENWGYCGEHRHFIGTYRCECGNLMTIGQCEAYPITDVDCSECWGRVECELSEGNLR